MRPKNSPSSPMWAQRTAPAAPRYRRLRASAPASMSSNRTNEPGEGIDAPGQPGTSGRAPPSGPLQVRAAVGADADLLARADEGGNLHRDAGFRLGRLERTGGGRIADARLGLDHRQHDAGGQLHADRAAVVKVDLHFQVRQQVAGLALQGLGL